MHNLTKIFKFMKKAIFLIGLGALIITGLGVYSCQKGEEIDTKEQERKEVVAKFENSLKEKSSEIQILSKELFTLRAEAFKKGIVDKKFQNEQEEKAKQTLTPLLQDSKKLLLEYGIDDDFLKEEFGSTEDPRIIQLSLLFLSAEKIEAKRPKISEAGFFTFLKLPSNLMMYNSENSGNDWYDCLLRSVGIDSVIEIMNNKVLGSDVAKKAMKKAIRKAASRTLGWVGAAIAVYEFGDCMDWY